MPLCKTEKLLPSKYCKHFAREFAEVIPMHDDDDEGGEFMLWRF